MLIGIPQLLEAHGWQITAVLGLAAAAVGARRYGRRHEQQTRERPTFPKTKT